MKKYLLVLIFSCGQMLFGWSGSGTSGDPYLISSVAELATLATNVNSVTNYSGVYFKQMNDLNLNVDPYNTGTGWTPIGVSEYHPFCGNYNGDGHIVSGLYINRSSNYQGLFGYIGYSGNATIRNLGATGVNISGGASTGGLVGYVYSSTVSNCYAAGSVSGSGNIGGLIGATNVSSTIGNCYSTCTVTGSTLADNVGGLVGFNLSSTINRCYSSGNVSGGITTDITTEVW